MGLKSRKWVTQSTQINRNHFGNNMSMFEKCKTIYWKRIKTIFLAVSLPNTFFNSKLPEIQINLLQYLKTPLNRE